MRAGTGTGPRSLGTLAMVALVLLPLAAPATAAENSTRHIDVVQVSGGIDPIVVDFLDHSVAESERGGAEALVIQLDSPGSLVSHRRLHALRDRLRHASVPAAIRIRGRSARAQ